MDRHAGGLVKCWWCVDHLGRRVVERVGMQLGHQEGHGLMGIVCSVKMAPFICVFVHFQGFAEPQRFDLSHHMTL